MNKRGGMPLRRSMRSNFGVAPVNQVQQNQERENLRERSRNLKEK